MARRLAKFFEYMLRVDSDTLMREDSQKAVQRLILFGSFVRNPLAARDIDVAVETSVTDRLKTETRALILRCLLTSSLLPISLHIFRPAEFLELKNADFFGAGDRVIFSRSEAHDVSVPVRTHF